MNENQSHINMSDGLITCVVTTPVPLPVAAYEVLGKLAEAVADAVVELNGILADAGYPAASAPAHGCGSNGIDPHHHQRSTNRPHCSTVR